MKKFVTLGTECDEYLKAAKASEGTLFPLACLPQAPFLASLSYSFFPVFTIDALATANARILSLEDELEASRRAFDTATVAKTNAEKASKSALDKANKIEKSLADLKKRSRLSEIKPWLYVLIRCRLLLEVNTMPFPFLLFGLLVRMLH
jgi:hypothetical protein